MAVVKTIRIKFCGGCNPAYDRLALAKRVQKLVAAAEGVEMVTDGQPDVLVVICGCSCACADVEAFDGADIVMFTSDAPESPGMVKLRQLVDDDCQQA